jgi:hypothetical protein
MNQEQSAIGYDEWMPQRLMSDVEFLLIFPLKTVLC